MAPAWGETSDDQVTRSRFDLQRASISSGFIFRLVLACEDRGAERRNVPEICALGNVTRLEPGTIGTML